MYSCDILSNFGGILFLNFEWEKRQNRAWHGTNCVRTTACQILLKNALTSQKFQKWDLTIEKISWLSSSEICLITKATETSLTGVTAQIYPPLNYTRVYSGLYSGIIWNIPWGIVWELPEYTPGYIQGAPRVYPTSPDYTPSNAGWGVVWEIGVYSGRYYIWLQSIINLN